jgi:hypothetical protein
VLDNCIYIGEGVGNATISETNTIRIGDNLPIGPGASKCFIGGILSNFVPAATGDDVVTIDKETGQLGWTTDSAAGKVTELQKKIEEQQASIAELRSTVGVLTAQLREQGAQIQKVSAQLEVSKASPQTVLNNQ